jgi:hypothetical protein
VYGTARSFEKQFKIFILLGESTNTRSKITVAVVIKAGEKFGLKYSSVVVGF